MKLLTALEISRVCLLALAVEAILAYFLFSSYAFSLAGTERYTMTEAYTSGPMGNLALLFYVIFGVTALIGVAAPLFSVLSRLVRGHAAPGARN